MSDEPKQRMVRLCPGSHCNVGLKGPGSFTCPECKRFVTLLNEGMLSLHRRELDRHTPYDDDGVTYCGWATEVGVFDGCGQLWPCDSALGGR